MWTLEASYMELSSILNLADLSQTKLVSKKRKKARLDRKTTAFRATQMCSYNVIFLSKEHFEMEVNRIIL